MVADAEADVDPLVMVTRLDGAAVPRAVRGVRVVVRVRALADA
jgi:hypothetical protein